MPDENLTIDLSMAELREIAAYAVACAEPALAIYERTRPTDHRPRAAINAARAFATGANRTKAIRDSAWAAHRAYQETRDAGLPAASEAARAAVATASAPFLHPLPQATQIPHILGPAAHTARAHELAANDNHDIGANYLKKARDLATPTVISVLTRYPNPPSTHNRVAELVRILDAALRQPPTNH